MRNINRRAGIEHRNKLKNPMTKDTPVLRIERLMKLLVTTAVSGDLRPGKSRWEVTVPDRCKKSRGKIENTNKDREFSSDLVSHGGSNMGKKAG
jgi:hypothetical protein